MERKTTGASTCDISDPGVLILGIINVGTQLTHVGRIWYISCDYDTAVQEGRAVYLT